MTQCTAHTKKGAGPQCKLNTVRQHPLCWQHLKAKEGLQVKPSTVPNAGKGLFYVGEKALAAGKRITAYGAAKVDTAATVNRKSRYVFEVGKNRFLDAQKPLNPVGRYINDPKGTGRRANVQISANRITQKDGRATVPIKTKVKVKPGTELLMSYGREFWK
jgi:hypothetical protein